jgi:hypothetical protein
MMTVNEGRSVIIVLMSTSGFCSIQSVDVIRKKKTEYLEFVCEKIQDTH